MQTPLILASSSPWRRDLLARLGLAFTCQSPGIDETAKPGESPAALARRLAQAKAEAISRDAAKPSVIVGSDQVASLQGEQLEKPGNAARAIAQLDRSSGRDVEFHTAVTVLGNGRRDSALDLTRVTFRDLNDAEIERYVEREKSFGCAGGFKAEGLGISLFDAVESQDPTALIGLPLIALARILRGFGYRLP
jgi:septum formation protein